ncbi:MAG TPA: amino acid deaminase [Acidobacteriaceae bacterium]|nr:amino acid deaminase [Acidobacteriaceae bacterium]
MVELNKGVGFGDAPQSWNILREEVSLPCAVLYQDRLRHNLEWMRQFIAAYGVKLAPHGKTTMAPRLFAMQLGGGAWGITLATAHQSAVAHAHGVRRVLMANQLVGRENMAIVSRLLEDSGFEFYCLVDSVANVEQLGAFFHQRGQRLRVLLELGIAGGRTGVRDDAQMQTVLAALDQHKDSLELCGIEMYEGVLEEEASIRAFLQRAVSVTRQMLAEDCFRSTPALLSGAGSAWYDVVAEEFSAAKLGDAVDVILRPGCYLTHDVGAYRAAQERITANNPVAQRMQSELLPALQVWAYVQSRPEPERAILAMGKRDAAFDSGLPVPAFHFRPGGNAPAATPAHWAVTKLMDQHAYMQVAVQDDVRVGDMVGFDIAHPCLTFDKWRTLLIVNANYDVVDTVETFF